MIIIRYSEWNARLEGWREKLEELVIAHRFEQDEALATPHLLEKERAVRGEMEIAAFLRQLEKDINGWREPKCGV